MKNHIYLIIILLCCFSNVSIAQEFEWESGLQEIAEDGFYKIQLSPEIVSKLNSQLSDIRVFDKNNKEVPYLYKSEEPLQYQDYFTEYKIIEKKEQTSWPYYTRIVIQNPGKTKISNIHLIIKNSDVYKSLKLSGSDDNSKWYVIKDGYRFHSMFSEEETSVIKIIDFPLSNYEYYEILIDDWRNNPINILSAGFYNTSVEKGKYSGIEVADISQAELKDEKQTLVKLSFKSKELIHKLRFQVEGSDFFHRNAEIQVLDSTMDKRKKFQNYFKTIANVILSSNSDNTFYFNNLKTDIVYIRINNHDDQPLTFKKPEVGQLNQYLVSKLEKGNLYTLKFGNQHLTLPIYDIKYFSDKIPEQLPILTSGQLKQIHGSKEKGSGSFNLDKKYIWVAIVVVVILLVYMILAMLKDMKKDKTEKVQ